MKKTLVLLVVLLVSGVARANIVPISLEEKRCWDAGGAWMASWKEGERCEGANILYYIENSTVLLPVCLVLLAFFICVGLLIRHKKKQKAK